MIRFLAFSFLTVLCCGLLISCGGAGLTSLITPQGSPNPVPEFAHVVLVVEENHSYSDVIGNPSMPFLNSLASQNGVATDYFADVHPSIGNYFMLTAGEIITLDDNFDGVVTEDNVVRELNSAGKTWKSYVEALPSAGYLGGDVYPYLKHHNPFAYFSDVTTSAAQAADIVPFPQLAGDLASNRLPSFVYIAPDAEHDAHDCPDGGQNCSDDDKLRAADQWLQQNLSPLLSNLDFRNNGLLMIVFDEGNATDFAYVGGHVPLVVVSSRAKSGFQSTRTYQHESTLRMIMEATGTNRFPGASATAPDMGEFFR